jgi:hypothetical protein
MHFRFYVRGSTRSSNFIERENFCILWIMPATCRTPTTSIMTNRTQMTKVSSGKKKIVQGIRWGRRLKRGYHKTSEGDGEKGREDWRKISSPVSKPFYSECPSWRSNRRSEWVATSGRSGFINGL